MELKAEMYGANVAAQRLRALASGSPAIAGREMYITWQKIMEASKELVPVDEGPLRASAYVDLPQVVGGEVTVNGGYSASYAAAVHENPRAGKTGGVSPTGQRYRSWAKVGQWKFLEIPFKRIVVTLPARIRLAILGDRALTNQGPVQDATNAGFHGS